MGSSRGSSLPSRRCCRRRLQFPIVLVSGNSRIKDPSTNRNLMQSNELKLYSRSKDNIWTDPHIAQQMLAAHLDLSHDAATRNAETVQDTIDWIHSISDGNRDLIDLGCGPGIYATRFHDLGYRVTGVDVSQTSISYAVEKAEKENKKILYRVINYVEEPLQGNFDLAVCIYCDFGALIPGEQAAFLANVRSVLDEDGIFIFDVFGPRLRESKREERTWTIHRQSGFWSPHPHIELCENVHFEKEMAWGSRTIILEEGNPRSREYITWDSYYTREKLSRLLEENGFILEEVRTDLIQSNSFTSGDVLFIKARKA